MSPLKTLTRREWQVLELLLQGRPNKQIALALDISIRTVEFHLKNIYAKHEVASRVELILLLGQAAGTAGIENPGESTVVSLPANAENGGSSSKGTPYWKAAAGRETDMKNLFTRHITMGVAAALLAGLLWVVFLRSVGNMSAGEISLWILPMFFVWVVIGAAAGWAGRRSGSPLLWVGFSSLAATGFSPFAVLLLMGFVVLPFAKLLERLGLIDGATMHPDTASLLAVISMLLLWLALGATAGGLLSMLTLRPPRAKHPQTPAA